MSDTYLRSPRTIRERCERILAAGLEGTLEHFKVDLAALAQAARLTAQVTRKRYPSLEIPPHSRFGHFDVGGVQRLAALEARIAEHPPEERARRLADVVILSVLLDAGAGPSWRYCERDTGLNLGRSEGLAVASLAWLAAGGLSSRGEPYEVDAAGLSAVDERALGEAFQVSEQNPLVGVQGRVALLRALGGVIERRPDLFGARARPGGLVDVLRARATEGVLPAPAILEVVLDGLGSIWPGRLSLNGIPLGDVWRHPKAGGEGATAGLVPFHKLSQWLSYSLLRALSEAGLEVVDLDALTGLAEYRNGGLFVDTGVLVPKHAAVLESAHEVSSEVVVEWRALTVCLLDRIAPLVREELGVDAARLPLAAVLEGGTWAAGREIAAARRPDGGPPIRVISDGTVF